MPIMHGDTKQQAMTMAAVSLMLWCGSWAMGQIGGGNPKAGQPLYEQHCLRCHGDKLDGNGPEAQYLIVRPPDLRSLVIRNRSDRDLLSSITNGVLFSPMHGFRGKLTEQQMLDVLSYIRLQSPPEFIS
ncbi:MAG TPA: cytochrome c [Nitrospira sp.]|nr:cytochrome c [Nitrospira sp.]